MKKSIFILFVLLLVVETSCSPICKKDIESLIWLPTNINISEQFCKSVNISNNYYLVIHLEGLTKDMELEFLTKNNLIKKKYFDFSFNSFFPENFITKIHPDELYFRRISSDGKNWLINYSNEYLFVSRSVMIM